jgi:hypothetical protein
MRLLEYGIGREVCMVVAGELTDNLPVGLRRAMEGLPPPCGKAVGHIIVGIARMGPDMMKEYWRAPSPDPVCHQPQKVTVHTAPA